MLKQAYTIQQYTKHNIGIIIFFIFLKLNTSLAAKGQDTCLPPAKLKMAGRGSQNGWRGLESGLPPDFWALLLTFAK